MLLIKLNWLICCLNFSDINLLDDDLGDDADYDLGNEDEDALLADDYDPLVMLSKKNS